MPLFSSTDLERFYEQAENDISTDKPFMPDRISIATIVGVSTYTLPDYCCSIRRITYLGQKLDPLPRRNEREVFQSADQQGRPFWYVYNQIGANQIKLFPTPGDNLPADTGHLWSTDIPNCCIVEFFRATDNVNFVLPSFIKRQLLKQYVAKRAFAIDGPGMNMKLVQYFDKRWQTMKGEFYELLDDLYTLPRKLLVDEIVSSNYFPGEPVLPINQFGISVDEGF